MVVSAFYCNINHRLERFGLEVIHKEVLGGIQVVMLAGFPQNFILFNLIRILCQHGDVSHYMQVPLLVNDGISNFYHGC